MKLTIRNKLVIAISTLIVVLFGLTAAMFISEKRVEIASDIYENALSFSRLTAGDVVENYDLYLAENSFVYFNRAIHDIFEQNDDVAGLSLVSYSGDLLYDSVSDLDKRFDGERVVGDYSLQQRVKAEHISVRTLDGGTYYLKYTENGFVYVNAEELQIAPFEKGTLIDSIVVPADERYSVVYTLDYHNLRERVAVMIERIVYLAVFGILLGILMAVYMAKRVTKPVSKLVTGAEGIATGDFNTRVDIQTGDELEYLGQTFNKMAQDLEASMEARVFKERVSHELSLARKIQQTIIPDTSNMPKVLGLDVAASLIPAEEMGGDMYDFFATEKRLVMYLGDVTGHGLPAGIVSSIASALFYGNSENEDLCNVMANVNRVLKAKTMANMFMTLCLMDWNIENQLFRYVSAGHEQLIHFKAAEGAAELTPEGGIALGMVEDVSDKMKEEVVPLGSGDFIIVYSDGIAEAWRDEEENYGIERLKTFVEKAAKGTAGGDGVPAIPQCKTAEEMRSAILTDVEKFRNGYKQMDDITLIVLRKD